MWDFLPESIKLSQKLNFKNSQLMSEIGKKIYIVLPCSKICIGNFTNFTISKMCDTSLSCNAIKCNESLTFRGVRDF